MYLRFRLAPPLAHKRRSSRQTLVDVGLMIGGAILLQRLMKEPVPEASARDRRLWRLFRARAEHPAFK